MINKLSIRLSLIIFLVLSFFLLSCSGKNSTVISKETNLIVKKIEKINILMGSGVGFAGIKPEQYDNFEALQETASKEELVLLTNHSNAVVRCYSFWALGQYRNVDLFSIVKKHLSDTTTVATEFGCVLSSETTANFYVNLVNPKYENFGVRKLSEEDFNILDSILIRKKHPDSSNKSENQQTSDRSDSLVEILKKKN